MDSAARAGLPLVTPYFVARETGSGPGAILLHYERLADQKVGEGARPPSVSFADSFPIGDAFGCFSIKAKS